MADIQRYLDLITSEHYEKPKFTLWLTAALNIVDDVVTAANTVSLAFDIDLAIGAQLDVLGSIVGRSRQVDFQPSDNVSPVLDDDTYRMVIKAKIAQNQWDGTIPSLYDLWDNIFPLIRLMLVDNQNMTLSAAITGMTSQLQEDLVTNGYIIPKPQGVKINYSFTNGITFAYDFDNTAYSGYDNGYWI